MPERGPLEGLRLDAIASFTGLSLLNSGADHAGFSWRHVGDETCRLWWFANEAPGRTASLRKKQES